MAQSTDRAAVHVYEAGQPDWPTVFKARLGDTARNRVAAIGNLAILNSGLLAFFCSRKCPGALILKAYDWARDVRTGDTAVVSGFHSGIEKDCLEILLRGKCPIVVCPARAIQRMRISKEWREPIASGRLLMLSPFASSLTRPTSASCDERNRFAVKIADEILIVHAFLGSRTEALCRRAIMQGKPVLTFRPAENRHLLALGAESLGE